MVVVGIIYARVCACLYVEGHQSNPVAEDRAGVNKTILRGSGKVTGLGALLLLLLFVPRRDTFPPPAPPPSH